MKKGKLLKLIKVKPGEAKVVFLTVLFSFCVGIVQNIMTSVPLAMFLSRFSSSYLPHIYIACGASTFVVGLAFAYMEKKFSIFQVLSFPIGFFSATLFLFWGLLLVVKSPIIFVCLLVWALVIASLIISIVMLLSNQLFTIQQSKRIYGLILVGIATGGIIVGLGMKFLIEALGTNQLILLAALILSAGFITQFWIKKHSGNRLSRTEHVDGAEASRASWKSFKNKKYILSVFLLTIIIYSIYYSFDLLLNTIIQQKYPNEVEMAAFFGLLYAIFDFALLGIGLFAASWLLLKYGLIISLLLWPVGLVVLMSSFFFMNGVPALAGIIFFFTICIAVYEVTIRETITEQTELLLFQPLRPVQRAWAQLKNEVIISPLSMALIGGLLLVFEKSFGVNLSFISLLIIGLSLAAIALIFFSLKKGYLNLLEESLSKRSIANPRFTTLNKDSLAVLKSHLKSHYPEEVIYVLQTIEKIDKNEFTNALIASIDHPVDEVRTFALGKIEQYRIKSAGEKIKKLCLGEKSPAVLGAALLALGAITDFSFKNYLKDPHIEVVSSALIALIKYGSEEAKKEAIELLNEEDHLIVATALKHIDIPSKVDLLLNLLNDPDLEVRIAASEACQHCADERLFPLLIENLEVSHVHDAALRCLISYGKKFSDYIFSHFEEYPLVAQINLIKVLGFIKGANPAEFLQNLLPKSNRRMLHPILQSLKKHSYKTSDPEKLKMIDALLDKENDNILYLKEMARSFNSEKTKLLYHFLCREIELAQECCFSLLGFVYPESSIIKAQQGLTIEDEDTNSNAVELLLQTLEMRDQKQFMEQLTYAPYKEEAGEGFNESNAEDFLQKIQEYTTNCFIPALGAAVMYEIGVLKLKNLAGLLLKQELRNDPLMKESVDISLKKLEIT